MKPPDAKAPSGLEPPGELNPRRGSKLFCRCPAGRYVDHYDAEVLRHMRPTLSELGEYDGTALMEFKTRKEIVYRLERGTVCTYEIDEGAIRIALEICLLMYPNMQADVIDALVEKGYKGIVIAGTGLGHVNRKVYPALERARRAGVCVFMTLQTLWGFVQMHVYETGREILGLGVIPLANMLPEVAYIKLGWAMGLHAGDPEAVAKLMTTPLADEMTEREPHDGYLVLQGGVPEIQELLGHVWK
jgi:L-asparaginase/Glu-tRNA(Gln) amidotransferase subunit D